MADPITREQVERLLVEVQSTTGLATAQVALGILGNGWLSVCPPYVAEFFDVRVTLPEAFRAALTRWRDELAAAEPAPVAHHAASERVAERLRAMTPAEGLAALVDAGIVTPDGELTEAYSARPEPAEDSPERLRERREALGWHRARTADGLPLLWHDIERLETGRTDDDADDRAIYAAALSAEEARRAAKARAEPERPAPRFKVGDWVRVCGTYATHRGTAYQIVEIVEGWHRSKAGSGECSYAETELEPASPPAPEVVDVPQPVTIVKRCDTVTASWTPGKGHLTVRTMARDMDVPIALLRAMLEAIDAQQGGAS